MSVNVLKDNGVTVITFATDRKSMLPPLCQIFKSLCYSPMCCSVNGAKLRISSMATVGAIQIMVGLFSIGLGPGRTSLHPGDFTHLGVAYWLGGMFILAGIVSVLGSMFPSRSLVGFSVFMNIVGAIFSVAGIVLYAIDLVDASYFSLCDDSNFRRHVYDRPDQCRSVEFFFKRMLISMDVTMIVLTVLQLAVSICFTVLPIKALVNMEKEEVGKDVEAEQPEMKKPLLTSPGA